MSAPSFTVDGSGDFRQAAKALEHEGFERQAGRTVAWALRRAANAVRRHVRAEVRKHRRSGHLAGNVRTRFDGVGLDFVARVRTGGPIAHLIVGGVAPHAIAPGKVMAIHGPGRSGPVVGFATAVQHPGFRADPYFHRGVKASQRDIDEILAKSADTMVRELAYRMRGRA